MVQIICAIIAGACAIVVAVVGRNVSKANARNESHAELRREESLLSLRMMDATLQLSVVSANALTNGHNNGNVEKARDAAKKVSEEYTAFMQRTTAYEVGK